MSTPSRIELADVGRIENYLLASGDRTSDKEAVQPIEGGEEEADSATTCGDDDAGTGADGEEEPGDDVDEMIGSLPGLPDEDYGQRFEAPAPSRWSLPWSWCSAATGWTRRRGPLFRQAEEPAASPYSCS